MTPEELVQYYQLQPHPEGGYFGETYRSGITVNTEAMPGGFSGPRSCSTAIYFLVLPGNFSAFHRLRSDELWHFYSGGCLHLHIIHPTGRYELKKLGSDIHCNEQFQLTVPAGCWFAAETAPGTRFSLTGCTMAPGFDFADFELAAAKELTARFPQHSELINRLCRQ